jgi:hypothetical protein
MFYLKNFEKYNNLIIGLNCQIKIFKKMQSTCSGRHKEIRMMINDLRAVNLSKLTKGFGIFFSKERKNSITHHQRTRRRKLQTHPRFNEPKNNQSPLFCSIIH